MHHLDIGRQKILHAIAEDRVGVAAAELHEAVFAIRCSLGGDALGEGLCKIAIAILIDMLHDKSPPCAALGTGSG